MPDHLRNCHLQYKTDSQAKVVVGMKGANECLDAVADVYRLCAVMDTDVEVIWRRVR